MGDHMIRRPSILAALALSAMVALGACSSSNGSSSASTTTTTAAPRTLEVLVTNDDGYDAAGLDAVVEGLRALPNVHVTVVAPATNQSGKGGAVTAGTLTATDGTTKSGYAAKAVAGTPADTIVWAIDQKGISFTPDFVVSGINAGQNMGPVVDASGTVGAARAAAQRGIPAIATSQGITNNTYDYASGAKNVVAWFTAHRDAIADHSITHATVFNMNIPTCPSGSPREQVQDPPATTSDGYLDVPNCASTAPNPGNDIAAFHVGFVPISDLPIKPAS